MEALSFEHPAWKKYYHYHWLSFVHCLLWAKCVPFNNCFFLSIITCVWSMKLKTLRKRHRLKISVSYGNAFQRILLLLLMLLLRTFFSCILLRQTILIETKAESLWLLSIIVTWFNKRAVQYELENDYSTINLVQVQDVIIKWRQLYLKTRCSGWYMETMMSELEDRCEFTQRVNSKKAVKGQGNHTKKGMEDEITHRQ